MSIVYSLRILNRELGHIPFGPIEIPLPSGTLTVCYLKMVIYFGFTYLKW